MHTPVVPPVAPVSRQSRPNLQLSPVAEQPSPGSARVTQTLRCEAAELAAALLAARDALRDDAGAVDAKAVRAGITRVGGAGAAEGNGLLADLVHAAEAE